jgi:predicted permease
VNDSGPPRHGRPTREAELDAELREHFEREVDERVRAGASEAEARRAVRIAWGGFEQVKEACRDVRPMRGLEQLSHDLRFGARSLRGHPGFTLLVVATMGLGLAASAVIFRMADAVLLRPLPVRDPTRLVLLSSQDGPVGRGPHPAGPLKVFSHPLYRQLLADNQAADRRFEDLAAEQSGTTRSAVERPGEAGQAEQNASGRCVTANYFSVLGVAALRGRTLLPGDASAAGANPVLVLSHHYWRRRFGADPGLLGAPLMVNGRSYRVVGITPPGFVGSNVGQPTDFWVPLTMQAELMLSDSRLESPSDWWLLVTGRLASGVSPGAAEARVNVTVQQFLAAHPDLVPADARPAEIRAVLEPAAQGVPSIRNVARDPLLTLMAGVGLLLLVSYVNVAHLLLARGSQRQREMSIRAALGATPSRIGGQLVAEGALLAGLSGTLALLLVPPLQAGLIALLPGRPALNLGADVRLGLFALGLGLCTAALLGLVPAWQLRRANPRQDLRATAPIMTRGGRGGLPGRALLISQVALSALLLVGAGLLGGTLQHLRRANKGFDEAQLLVLETNFRVASPGLRRARVPDGPGRQEATVLYDDVLSRVAALPGVNGASLSVHGLLSGSGWLHDLWLPESSPSQRLRAVNINGVSPGYFQVVGMPLLRGRGFTAADQAQAPRVAAVNETLARRLFGGADPLGRRLRDGDGGEIEVVGLVRDARVGGLHQQPPPMYFVPLAQQDHFATTLEVRTGADPAALAHAVRQAVQAAHPGLPVISLRTMSSQVEQALGGERLLATLSAVFALAALLLVCLGLYGVVSRWAARRTPEIGLRLALGQSPAGVRWLVMRQAFGLVLAGLGIGLPAAAAGGHLLRGLLFGLDPLDPRLLSLAAALLLLVTGAAAYLPARRASHIAPIRALRCE